MKVYMKKIIIALMLTILNTPTFAEPQSTQQPAAPTQPTTQTQTPPRDSKTQETPKESTPSIIDFCRTHTC